MNMYGDCIKLTKLGRINYPFVTYIITKGEMRAIVAPGAGAISGATQPDTAENGTGWTRAGGQTGETTNKGIF